MFPGKKVGVSSFVTEIFCVSAFLIYLVSACVYKSMHYNFQGSDGCRVLFMSFYKGKTVLVTGASSGIGMEFARQLSQMGASLVLTARRKEVLERFAETLRQDAQAEVLVMAADLGNASGVDELCDALDKQGCEIDVLVNNAGFGFNGSFLNGDQHMYATMMQLNMISLVTLTRRLLPSMVSRGEGGVLNVSSMAGFLPIPWFSVYAATKQFVNSFSWSLWKELRGTGVHVGVLCPGPVDTGFLQVAGMDKNKAMIRGLQDVHSVARRGLKALEKDKGLAVSRPALWFLYLLSRLTPVKLGMNIGAITMKKTE